MKKADEYVKVYNDIIASKTEKDNINDVKVKALAKIMTMFTNELTSETVKRQLMKGSEIVPIIENQIQKYKAFADKVKVNPMGFYVALKAVNPGLIDAYDKYKASKQ